MTVQYEKSKLTPRQAEILTLIQKSGFATLEALAERYDVSMQTVRRDIIALSNAGQLQRFHGGAGPVESKEATRLDYESKRSMAQSEKLEIAQRAAAIIEDGSTLFLDVGTTLEACATILAKRSGFTVFTNSMPAAMKFDPKENQVFIVPGRVAGRDGSIVGTDAVNVIRDVSIDYALVGCSTIDDNNRVMDFDLDKIAIKRAAMAAARKSLLLATQSKFGRTALAVIAPSDDFDAIITKGS
ncbi:MAG: DeoR/GlpR family DNA-binding transcription regulator [Pseudomonadota bacterium]